MVAEPALTQEEVARRAGIGRSYYGQIERGTVRNDVSEQVLDAIATTLKMDEAQHRHLYVLALRRLPAAAELSSEVQPSIRSLVDRQAPDPSYVIDTAWNVLYFNDAVAEWFVDWNPMEPADRNVLFWVLTDPEARRRLLNWETDWVDQLMSRFRAAHGRHPEDPRFQRVLDRLLAASPHARERWERPEMVYVHPGVVARTVWHPRFGEVQLDIHVRPTPSSNDQLWVIFQLPPQIYDVLRQER